MVDVSEVGRDRDIQKVALTLHSQRLQQLLTVMPLLDHIEKQFEESGSNWDQRYVRIYSTIRSVYSASGISDACTIV